MSDQTADPGAPTGAEAAIFAELEERHAAERRNVQRIVDAAKTRYTNPEAFRDALCELVAEGVPQVFISDVMGVTRQRVNHIIKGR